MNTINDPYEGARQAFLIVNRNATDADWETWTAGPGRCEHHGFDKFGAYAALCRNALASSTQIDPNAMAQIAFAEGTFVKLHAALTALEDMWPASQRVPHHFARYRARLLAGKAPSHE